MEGTAPAAGKKGRFGGLFGGKKEMVDATEYLNLKTMWQETLTENIQLKGQFDAQNEDLSKLRAVLFNHGLG